MTELAPAYDSQHWTGLPAPARNLAKRAIQLAGEMPCRRHRLELIFANGSWLLFVNGSDEPEMLGSFDAASPDMLE